MPGVAVAGSVRAHGEVMGPPAEAPVRAASGALGEVIPSTRASMPSTSMRASCTNAAWVPLRKVSASPAVSIASTSRVPSKDNG